MRPFGCPVTFLNTLDHLGKFDGKADEGFLVGQGGKEKVPDQEYILLPLLHTSLNVLSSSKEAESSPKDDVGKNNGVKDPAKEGDMNGPGEATNTNSTNRLNTVSSPVNIVSSSFATEDLGKARAQRNEFESLFGQDKDDNNNFRVFTPVNDATPSNADYPIDPLMPDLEDTANLQDIGIFGNAYDDEDVGAEADINNLETTMSVSPIPTTRIHKDHPKGQIIREVDSAVQTRRMHKQNEAGLITFINKQRRTNHKDFQNCLFTYFLSQMEPKKVTQALDDESWVEAMQEELLQFKLLNVWTLVDLPHGKRAIAIRLFLAYASFMDFTVYQMDVKSAFLYGTIEEEVEQRQDGIFLSQDKYVYDILKKFGYSSVKTTTTPMETHKPLLKDADGIDVDVHLYRSMIGSLMYLTSSRPDIIYLKGQPTLGLWYPKDSPLDLIAYSDSDYAGASIDRKSTTGSCQFLDLLTKAFDVTRFQFLIASIGLKLKGYELNKGYVDSVKMLFVDQHNMVAFLENSDDNSEFHQIVDFLSSCSINYALTVSPTIYASYIEQFWNTATSKTVNNLKQIHAIVDDKAVVISESSVRNDLLFDDEDGITCLTNAKIFENLALMGYEQLSTKLTFQKGSFSPQ
ncbi:hypothetical protein Tco_0877807 [Tanacetum coccineum]|uniref:Reverse transcriptase Ty1/copia-type domain-containing protein n=1 Tax=Tanacetum coccineum TaxID=301880 RepID=A0ABQ5BW64_9ASTR